jgi:class 3 adenylate cyclase
VAEIDYVRSGDLWIAYRVVGDGPLDLVMVPGLITNLEVTLADSRFADLPGRLSSFSRLIMMDKRGTGLSDRVIRTESFEDLMDDLRAVLDAVGSQRTALFGTEEGGALCALFAATYPERTSALALYGSFARRMRAPDYPWGLPEEMRARIIETYERRWGRDPVGLRTLVPSLADDEALRRAYVRSQRLGASPGAAIEWARWMMQIDIRGILPAIRVPTLVLHRAGDRAVDIGNSRYLAEHIPGAHLVELPGGDHIVWAGFDEIADHIEEFLTGRRTESEPDRLLATVLFTDIVGSTRRSAEIGDRRWSQLLDQHDRIVRAELERFRGREVKTIGDGFLATFDGPARAIRCALAVCQAVRGLGIEVRAGLHSGECEVRGEDVGGIAVAIGARVAELAGPGEVLVSSTVKDLVVGSGIGFADRGVHSLKGVPGSWRLLAVER